MTTVAPINPSVAEFARLAEAFAQSPTADLLRRLQAQAARIMPALGTMTAASVATMSRAVALVMSGISAGAAAGTIAGPLAAFIAWAALFSVLANARLPDERKNRAHGAAAAIASVIAPWLIGKGHAFKGDCYNKLVAEFEAKAAARELIGPDEFMDILRRFIACLTGKKPARIDLALLRAIVTALKSSATGALLLGVLSGGVANAGGTYTKDEATKLKNDWGITGLPATDGVSHDEDTVDSDFRLGGGAADDETLDPWEVAVDAGLDLRFFDDEQLEKRIGTLTGWVDKLNKDAKTAAAEAKKHPKGSTERENAKLREKIARREAERLKKALDNAKGEKKARKLRTDHVKTHGLPNFDAVELQE